MFSYICLYPFGPYIFYTLLELSLLKLSAECLTLNIMYKYI
jgi:hypothetical protein